MTEIKDMAWTNDILEKSDDCFTMAIKGNPINKVLEELKTFH